MRTFSAMELLLACALLAACTIGLAGEVGLTGEEEKLLFSLADQTGNTDGYPQSDAGKYNIDQHEPAKSIIALGKRAVSGLLLSLYDLHLTKAEWFGRSSYYRLNVGDIATLILGHLGGPEELKVLKRRAGWQNKIWRDAGAYVLRQQDWNDQEKAAYMDMFYSASSGQAISLWAIARLEGRLKVQDKDKR